MSDYGQNNAPRLIVWGVRALLLLVAVLLCTGCPVRDQIEENSVRDTCRIETDSQDAYDECVKRQGVEP